LLGCNVDSDVQLSLEVHETSIALEVDEKVQIAQIVRLAPGNGSEDAHITRAVSRGYCQNRLPIRISYSFSTEVMPVSFCHVARTTPKTLTAFAP
jgi:hypothetical protein